MSARKYLRLKLMDYCFASRWSDEDPQDPWAVGWLIEIRVDQNGQWFKLQGHGVPDRLFPHCRKITEKQGRRIVAHGPKRRTTPTKAAV